MSFLNRLLKSLQDSPWAPFVGRDVGVDNDPLALEVTDLACGIAKRCAGLTPDEADEKITEIVVGYINEVLSRRTIQAEKHADQVRLDVARAREQEQVADRAAEQLDREANDVENTAELQSSRVREAKEQLRALRVDMQDLPLLARVQTPLILIVVAVLGSAAGVGALARLSLEGVTEEPTKLTVTIAAGCVAFATELIIGTLGADNYNRIPAQTLRWVIPLVMLLVVVLIVGTEIFAAIVRQEGLEATQHARGGPGGSRHPQAPSLLWTGPLAILATISGSGVVGLTRVKESSRTRFEDLEDTAARLKAAEAAVRRDEAAVKQMREEATRRREQAAQLRGTASTAQAHSDNFSATLKYLSQQHAELIRAITNQAKLEYLIERQARLDEGTHRVSFRQVLTLVRAVSLTVGVSVLAGTLAALLTAAVAPGLLVGSITMIITAHQTTWIAA